MFSYDLSCSSLPLLPLFSLPPSLSFLSFVFSPLPPLVHISPFLPTLSLMHSSFFPLSTAPPPTPAHFSLPHLQKELGDRLLPCFKSTSGIPFSDVNLLTGHAHAPEWGPDSSVSEVSTIQMEFRDLTQLTNDHKYQVMPYMVNLRCKTSILCCSPRCLCLF